MRHLGRLILTTALLAGVAADALAQTATPVARATKPNILVIWG